MLAPTPYPLIPWDIPPERERALAATEEGARALAEAFAAREELIRLARLDPFQFEPALPHWSDADRVLSGDWPGLDAREQCLFLILLGGNRSGKSRYAGWKTMRSAVDTPGSNILCLAENEKTSIQTQQAIIWHYLPAEWRALNGKRSPRHYIKYSEHHGFADMLLQLPNGSRLHFKTYNQDPGDCEGWMFGVSGKVVVGAWPDENLRVNWLAMLLRRLRFQQAQMLWSFTPINGMTPTIKEAVGSAAEVVESRHAELLAGRVNVPGLPAAHMPYIARAAIARGRVIYFWSELNPFGDGQRSFYEGVKEDCKGRSTEYIQRIAYGYTQDTVGRPFPLFSQVHVMDPAHIPAEGVNILLVDPAGGRNWSMVWARLCKGRFYVYRDWPDEDTFGEWAVPNIESTGDNPARLHKAGPAQNSLGHGIAAYKALIRRLEGEERVEVRIIDSRAARNPHVAEHGGTCILDDLEADEQDAQGKPVPGMEFQPSSGVSVEDGLTQVNELLWWDDQQPLDLVRNAPKLFVSSRCRQVIGALEHWPGAAGGDKHPWKDFADLLRYLALADLVGAEEQQEWFYV